MRASQVKIFLYVRTYNIKPLEIICCLPGHVYLKAGKPFHARSTCKVNFINYK